MNRFLLCGHSGSMNRGADAIAKSTAELIRNAGASVALASYHKEEDEKYGFDEYDEVIRYADFKRHPFLRLASIFFKLMKKDLSSAKVRQLPLIRYMKKNSAVSLSIGGDVYCYRWLPYQYIQMNTSCNQDNIPSVLWACSIEKEYLYDSVIGADIRKYDLIFPREKETYQYLIEAGFDEKKLFKMCDPAFTLKPQKVDISELENGSWVGVNISPIAYGKNKSPELVKQSFKSLIQHILKNSGNNVVLIPHVYQINKDSFTEDLKLHKEMYEEFRGTEFEGRIMLIDSFYNSKQLKYIISKCSVLVASRTHASIAGYSSFVPTLVIGYSIKAVGIAKDMFGTDENYVIWAKDISKQNDLIDAYKWIDNNKKEIKKQLESVIPEYQAQAVKAAEYLAGYYKNLT